MYKIRKSYTDYDGNQREEDFYFNFSEAEILEMEMTTEGGLEKRVQCIVDARDRKELVSIFKTLVLDSYGEKSSDGKYFLKNDDIKAKFKCTKAYSDIFLMLATNDEEAAKFINSVVDSAAIGKIKKDNETGEYVMEKDGVITPLLPVN